MTIGAAGLRNMLGGVGNGVNGRHWSELTKASRRALLAARARVKFDSIVTSCCAEITPLAIAASDIFAASRRNLPVKSDASYLMRTC
jgi:hypothetical protein